MGIKPCLRLTRLAFSRRRFIFSHSARSHNDRCHINDEDSKKNTASSPRMHHSAADCCSNTSICGSWPNGQSQSGIATIKTTKTKTGGRRSPSRRTIRIAGVRAIDASAVGSTFSTRSASRLIQTGVARRWMSPWCKAFLLADESSHPVLSKRKKACSSAKSEL